MKLYLKRNVKQWILNRRARWKQEKWQAHHPTNLAPRPLMASQTLAPYVQQFRDKLLLREEYDIPQTMFNQLLNEQMITPISSMKKSFQTLTCVRCFNNLPHLFAKIACSRCQQTHLYCRACIHMGRVLECSNLYQWIGYAPSWPEHENPSTWQGKLTITQQHAANKMRQAVQTNRTLLTWAVTGSGKTEMLFPSIMVALQAGKRICIATPRADVVRELLPRVQRAFQQIHVQGLYGGSRDNDGTAQLVIATTHQLLRFQHAFDVLIIDEIDAFPFHQDSRLSFAANRACKQDASRLYLTATPRKAQQEAMKRKQLDYVFVPIRFHHHLLPVPTFRNCFTLAKDVQSNRMPNSFLHWFRQRQVPTRQLLVFVPTIQVAERMQMSLSHLLLREGWISSEQQVTAVHAEDKAREEKIIKFRNKVYKAMVTTTILERGVTFPAVDVAVVDAGHHIFDEAALIQIAGRAGRSMEDPEGDVCFFHNGKTNGMVRARGEIMKMNERAKRIIQGEKG